jgi:DNA polymerase-3 subunit beta
VDSRKENGVMTTATVNRADLKHALGILTKCTFRKATVPVLQHVRLTANGHVQLEATDHEVAAVIKLERRERRGEFQALLPAGRLAEYVRKSKGETVTFEPKDKTTTSVDGIAAMVGLALDDFPTTLGEEGDLKATFAAGDFASALRLTEFAASTEVVRYALTGILLEVRGTKGVTVASDGKRLAIRRFRAEKGGDFRAIVPWRAAELLQRLAERVDPLDNVRVSTYQGGERLHFQIGGAGIFTRVIEGRFPDYELVIPATTEEATFDRQGLVAELERVRQVCTDKTLATRFTFSPGRLELFSKTQDVGEAKGSLRCDTSANLTIVFNPEYVLDYLKALGKASERVTVKLRDRNSAALFSGGKGTEYVLMPLTINI